MTISQNTLRRFAAVVATVFGILTQAVPVLHLPVAVSAVLTACAPIMEAIDHYANTAGPAAPAKASTSLVS